MAATEATKKISIVLGGAKKANRPSANGLKRPHSSLRDDENDERQEGSRAESVSHFDLKAGGALDERRLKLDKRALVISPQKNRDWKEASKRRRQQHAQSTPPKQENGALQVDIGVDAAEKRERGKAFGLNIMKRVVDEVTAETDAQGEVTDAADGQQVSAEAAQTNDGEVTREQTADERAMDALLGKTPQSTLVVPAVAEADVFKDDFKNAPDMASLEDYARVPVEEFGAAMLRGMGWKDGEGVGGKKDVKATKLQALQRRPALLGIGAKSDATIDTELGGWGRAARGKEVKIYNPVLLKNKATGELFTEEELQKRREEAQRLVYEEEFEKKERERRRRRDDADRDARDTRRRDDRDRRDRRRHENSDDEDYYRRKKEKEQRRRNREREQSDDDDGHRRRRHDRDRARNDERDRERRKERR